MNTISVIGLDLGDKSHYFTQLDEDGNVIAEGSINNTRAKMREFFAQIPTCRVVMEAGTHSPWTSELAGSLGHEVIVANPRRTRAIWDNVRKSDATDSLILARLGRFDRELLQAVNHRSSAARADLSVLRSRDILVRNRSALISHVRGIVKSFGYRLGSCTAPVFARQVRSAIPPELRGALLPVLEIISAMTRQIRQYDQEVESFCQQKYPEAMLLRTVPGVGPLTALSFVLILERADRFGRSRSVPAYLGLVPRRDQSGSVDKQLPISKSGDSFLRRLLVGCAHHILGPFGKDSALRSWGLNLADRGGGRGKRRAAVAVARKLAVVLHAMWRSGREYEPYHCRQAA